MSSQIASQSSTSVSPHGGGTAPAASQTSQRIDQGNVTLRSFLLGVVMTLLVSVANAVLEIVYNAHFLGAVPLPLGAVFSLLLVILCVNGPLKLLRKGMSAGPAALAPLSPAELLTVYSMTVMGSLLSTAGCDNFFLTTGAGLSYFSTRENGWADMFYQYVPVHFAPGWNGQVFQEQVIAPLYLGGVKFSDIPWHAWTVMLVGWGLFFAFLYGALFFLSLLLRKQWIENEALTFPLVQLPLQMVDMGPRGEAPPVTRFWADKTMWGGAAIVATVHLLRLLNFYYPDWPIIPSFHGSAYMIKMTEQPWVSMGDTQMELFFGAIGVAYLLTRELSFSFWLFLFVFKLQLLLSTLAGYPAASLPKDTYLGRPLFITWQSAGAWIMTGVLLLWSARYHIADVWRAARTGDDVGGKMAGEPFSARIILGGLFGFSAALLGWCVFSGINPLAAVLFLGLYGLTSMVLSRLIVEGGFLFPQTTFGALDTLTGSAMGASAIGAASLTRLSFLQPMMFMDMRSNILPAYLHSLKMASELKLGRLDTRKMLLCVAAAVAISASVSAIVTIAALYSKGGLASYTWFTRSGPEGTFNGAASMIKSNPAPSLFNGFWFSVGALVVWTLTLARSRFFWFPLHPLGYLISSGYPAGRLWVSFFIGWMVKSLMLKFGGQDWANKARPFFIGLILGNAVSMVLAAIYGFFFSQGSFLGYWPA